MMMDSRYIAPQYKTVSQISNEKSSASRGQSYLLWEDFTKTAPWLALRGELLGLFFFANLYNVYLGENNRKISFCHAHAATQLTL